MGYVNVKAIVTKEKYMACKRFTDGPKLPTGKVGKRVALAVAEIPAGSRVIVHNVYRKDAVVEYRGIWYRMPRRIIDGIPGHIKPSKG